MEYSRKGNSEKKLKDASTENNPLDTSVEGIAENETTGSGYSQAERDTKDATNTDYPNVPKHKGSRELIDKYNINDQAHSDSSMNDFVKTTSNSLHADRTDRSKNKSEE